MGGDKQLSGGALPQTEGEGGHLKNQGGCKAALKEGGGIRVLWLGLPIRRGPTKVGPNEGTGMERTQHARGRGGEAEEVRGEGTIPFGGRGVRRRRGPQGPFLC